jgi:DNA-3-methyladenine glycosylase II
MPRDDKDHCAMSHGSQDCVSEQAVAQAHLLASDVAMAGLAAAHGPIDPYQRPRRVPVHDGDLLEGLVFHVVGQSISERSALAAFARLHTLLDGSITAQLLAAASVQSLRDTGLSTTKARTLSTLAGAIEGKQLTLDELRPLPADEVTARLTALPGIGPWTAEIFQLYELRRPDAFPAWEIGLRKAVGLLDGNTEAPKTEVALRRAEGWRPYRSYAAGHLWRSLAQ